MEIEKERKLDILLHYDKSFREDWRLLHRIRMVVAGFYISLATALVGWFLKSNGGQIEPSTKQHFLCLLIVLAATATFSMGWFGSSANTLKRFLVQIEKALKLMEAGAYLSGDVIVPESKRTWGEYSIWAWGKGVVASLIISFLFIMIVCSI